MVLQCKKCWQGKWKYCIQSCEHHKRNSIHSAEIPTLVSAWPLEVVVVVLLQSSMHHVSPFFIFHPHILPFFAISSTLQSSLSSKPLNISIPHSLGPTLRPFFVLLHTSLPLCAQGMHISKAPPSSMLYNTPPRSHTSFLRARGCVVRVNRWCLSDKWKETWWVGLLCRRWKKKIFACECEAYTLQLKGLTNLALKYIYMCYMGMPYSMHGRLLQNDSPGTHCNHISPPFFRNSPSINAFSATSPVASAC